MRPYRLLVSTLGFRRGRVYKGRGPQHKGAYSAISPVTWGYAAWTADQTAEPQRLPGSGTFCFPGLHAAYREAMRLLAIPATQQVSVRTNQDRTLYLFNKNSQGVITGYMPERE